MIERGRGREPCVKFGTLREMGCTYLICDLGLCGLAVGLNSDHLEAVFGGVARGLVELLNNIGIFRNFDHWHMHTEGTWRTSLFKATIYEDAHNMSDLSL